MKNKEAILDMCDTLRRFLKEKKLELYADKTKILVFYRNGKEKKKIWKWREEITQKIQKFKYLGFTFNREDNYKDYVKELYRKDKMAANKEWGLDKKMFKDDFSRR